MRPGRKALGASSFLPVLVILGLVVGCAPIAAPPPTPTIRPPEAARPTPTAAPAPTPTKVPPEKVKVSYSTKTESQVPIFMALEKGFFQEENLDVELVQTASAISIKALIAGGHEFDTSGRSAKQAILEGAPLKIIMITTTRAPWYIYTRPEIKSLQGLKGKRIAVTAIGSALDLSASRVLRNRGIDPEKDVIWQGVGPGAARATALEAGAVEAVVVEAATGALLESKGFNRLADLGEEVKVLGGIATQDKVIREKPAAVKSFVRAYTKAVKFYKGLSPEARAWLEKFYAEIGQTDKAVAARLYEAMSKEFVDVRTTTEADMKQDADMLREELKVKEEVPVDKIYNLSFARQAAQELEGWRP